MYDKRVTACFLTLVAAVGAVYSCCAWTPSSYGILLKQIQAPDPDPVAGTSRVVRVDEWGLATPYFQAAVRNGFQRINETSFYREDLRNFYALPLKDWSLVFKPQLWAFFVLPPATAYAIYYAILMCGFLAGYHLLFRQLGVPAILAVAASLLVYFSGFVQFWWTTYAPLLAGLPWIVLIVLRPMRWWVRALLCAWAFPTLVLSHVYPTLLVALAWCALILVCAIRPSVLRSAGTVAALAVGIVAIAVVVHLYYAELIPIMRNTIYPGQRVAPAGTTSPFAVFSQIFPFFCFTVGDYHLLTKGNICEVSAVGSFLPLLTLCALRYRSLAENTAVRNTLVVLLAGFSAITLWEIAPLPEWIGRILFWNTGEADRWMFTSGLLLTLAALMVWSNRLIQLDRLRIACFLLIGPVASILLKVALLIRGGAPARIALSVNLYEILLCILVIAAGLLAMLIPDAWRAPLLVGALVLVNVYGFGRFNPLQPAGPIFAAPDTPAIQALRKDAAANDGIVVDSGYYGATLNGLGFRSVSHILMAPQLQLFRHYFPDMDADEFNHIFNRYAGIYVTEKPMPGLRFMDGIDVPKEAFVPIRNVRRMECGPPPPPNVCFERVDGAIDHVSAPDTTLTIQGWAPWSAETVEQGIRVLSARSLQPESLVTTSRPDIAERLADFRFVKAGFRLRISSTDGKPISSRDVVLVAFGTAQGDVRLSGGGCR